MTDLARSLIDAAAEAVHALRCGCGGPVGDAHEHTETAVVAVAAVLETLAADERKHKFGYPMHDLRGLAAEVRRSKP